MEEANKFYKPLNADNGEFRVLQLLAPESSIQDNDTLIAFEMKTVSLNDEPEFNALSYCWGKEAAVHEILVNGRRFAIRPNLYDYLKVFQYDEQSIPIFVDAICINQTNLEERSNQVLLMGDLYRSATTVIAWLGSVPETNFSFVLKASTMFSGSDDERKAKLDAANIALLVTGRPEYWSRLWIVQKFVLARRVIVQLGGFAVDADAVLSTLRGTFSAFMDAFDDRLLPSPCMHRVGNCESWMRLMIMLRVRNNLTQPRRITMAQAVYSFAGQQCTDARDKIYGLLGMFVGVVPVDYDMPLSELFVRTLTVAQLEHHLLADGSDDPEDEEYILATLYVVLVERFGWSWLHPTVALLLEETGATQCVWVIAARRYAVSLVPHSIWRRMPQKVFTKIIIALAHSFKKVVDIRLRLYKRRNAAMADPCDATVTRSFAEWTQLIADLGNKTEKAMQFPHYLSQLSKAFPECTRVQKLAAFDQRRVAITQRLAAVRAARAQNLAAGTQDVATKEQDEAGLMRELATVNQEAAALLPRSGNA